MASFTVEKTDLEFGNLTHMIQAQRVRLQGLHDEKFEYHRAFLSLDVQFDSKLSRVFVPEEKMARYHEVLQKIKEIQRNIDSTHKTIQVMQAEAAFLQTTD